LITGNAQRAAYVIKQTQVTDRNALFCDLSTKPVNVYVEYADCDYIAKQRKTGLDERNPKHFELMPEGAFRPE